MQLSFVETMRGTLRHGGAHHPVDFQIRTRQLARGRFAVDGVVHASPWLEEGPCEGTLTIGLWPASIAYDVCFRARDGSPLRLVGAKSPSVLQPLRSMSVLPIELRDGLGTVLAAGSMQFDLFELPEFIASWLPTPTLPRRRFEARLRAVTRAALTGGTP